MANSVTVQSAAKINLTLDILGRRDDGYHEVEMVMQTVGLYDTVRVEAMGSGIELSMNTGDVPADESNLAYKAAKLFLKEHDIKHGVRIYVEKRIPIAAGLAGGLSSGASAFLANLAASVVVAKLGTYAVSRPELLTALRGLEESEG